jgi:peptide/nickel transport system substrate-binding protein
MKRFGWRSAAACSLILLISAAAELRPQYGGTLRIAAEISPSSLDPVEVNRPETVMSQNITRLLFDTLVVIDDSGRVQPALATLWEADGTHQRWQFRLRRGVQWQDGSPLNPDAVAASLRAGNPGWNVYANADSVVVERSAPAPDLLAELAQARNAIVKRSPSGPPVGTGPFKVSEWQAAKSLTVTANEEYWAGRAFIDSISVEFGKPLRDQALGLQLGKLDIAEIPPEQIRHATMQGRQVAISAPMQLIAVVFARDPATPEAAQLRTALLYSIDRTAIRNVLLQGQGEIRGGLLPNWLTGYAFVFPAEFNLQRAQELRGDVARGTLGTLAYDASDPLARLIAERIALNARDAGITLQANNSSAADLKLVRIPVTSLNPQLALTEMLGKLKLPPAKPGAGSVEDLFQAESTALKTQRVIPLFQVPFAFVLGPKVRGLQIAPDGSWNMPDVWLANGTP